MKTHKPMLMQDARLENDNTVHIMVDYQNDFVKPGAPLYVPWAETLVVLYNQIIPYLGKKKIGTIVTRDSHPKEMDWFASVHGVAPFTPRSSIVPYLDQDFYRPDHCLEGTRGAKLYDVLHIDALQNHMLCEVVKGTDTTRELYSAFAGTDLAELLHAHEIQKVLVSWVATDRCVQQTAVDALAHGFDTVVITDLTKGIDPVACRRTLELVQSLGGDVMSSQDIIYTYGL